MQDEGGVGLETLLCGLLTGRNLQRAARLVTLLRDPAWGVMSPTRNPAPEPPLIS